MRTLLRFVALALALVAAPAALEAQQRGTVTGQVIDDASKQPLPDVSVVVVGTTLGGRTNAEGRYTIAGVPAGAHQVRANRLGYAARTAQVTVTEGTPATADFSMTASAVSLDQVVVTGTAGAAERRAQPAVVASVDATNIVEKGVVASVQDVLAARVPGVQVNMSSGSSGTSQQIRIRGASSISLSNEPLVFIDGVRADASSREVAWAGGQTSSRLFDINPEDIESIEVVKGPAAATLYGADASAGVIQIITKRGRAGTNRFSQQLSLEYNDIDAGFAPEANFGRCSAADTTAGSGRVLCEGQPRNTLVTDNPLQRRNPFRNGTLASVSWSGRGGGENYGYFVSLNNDQEEGTLPTNEFVRRSGRVNFNFTPTSKLAFDAGVGLYQINTKLPHNDNNVYGFLGGGMLGSPRSVRRDAAGNLFGGFYAANRELEAISAIENTNDVLRFTPTLTASYTPFTWFTNRVTLGADVSNAQVVSFFPKNDKGWYQGDANTGDLEEHRTTNTIYTLDYLGTMSYDVSESLASRLSFGAQVINEIYDRVSGYGTGFVTNANRVIGSAAQISSDQNYAADRSIGLLSQLELDYQDKLFLQFGARLDQNSSFGENANAFFLPKVGVSYVVSEEAFWAPLTNVVPTMRLRAAWGTTGRSPDPGASLETYNASPFALLSGGSQAGVTPLNPGNLNLKPEKGEEFEAGFDAGLFSDRLGLELTYYDKKTTNLLLREPIPPSSGFSSNPFVNIGKVVNRGFEYALNATVFTSENFDWTARVAGSTLHNEITSMGDIAAYGTTPRYETGYQVGSFFTRKIRSVNAALDTAIVSKDLEFWGNSLPTNEGNFSSTFTLFKNVSINAAFDWKRGFKIYNNTAQFRDRVFGNSEVGANCKEVLSAEECLRRFGTFIDEATGAAVSYSQVNEEYYEDGDFLRFRELAATFNLPTRFANRVGASAASLTVGGRNLTLWTDYTGADPEVLSSPNAQFAREDFLTVPQARRLIVKANFTF